MTTASPRHDIWAQEAVFSAFRSWVDNGYMYVMSPRPLRYAIFVDTSGKIGDETTILRMRRVSRRGARGRVRSRRSWLVSWNTFPAPMPFHVMPSPARAYDIVEMDDLGPSARKP